MSESKQQGNIVIHLTGNGPCSEAVGPWELEVKESAGQKASTTGGDGQSRESESLKKEVGRG